MNKINRIAWNIARFARWMGIAMTFVEWLVPRHKDSRGLTTKSRKAGTRVRLRRRSGGSFRSANNGDKGKL